MPFGQMGYRHGVIINTHLFRMAANCKALWFLAEVYCIPYFYTEMKSAYFTPAGPFSSPVPVPGQSVSAFPLKPEKSEARQAAYNLLCNMDKGGSRRM